MAIHSIPIPAKTFPSSLAAFRGCRESAWSMGQAMLKSFQCTNSSKGSPHAVQLAGCGVRNKKKLSYDAGKDQPPARPLVQVCHNIYIGI